MAEFSKYQQKIIQRYYDNRGQIDHQRLSELVADLYLTEGKKQEKLWETVRTLLERMKVPESRIEHVMSTGDPAQLAEVVQDMEAGRIK